MPKREELVKTIAMRVPARLLRKIEKFHRKLASDSPNVRVNQSDAIRTLLEKATEGM